MITRARSSSSPMMMGSSLELRGCLNSPDTATAARHDPPHLRLSPTKPSLHHAVHRTSIRPSASFSKFQHDEARFRQDFSGHVRSKGPLVTRLLAATPHYCCGRPVPPWCLLWGSPFYSVVAVAGLIVGLLLFLPIWGPGYGLVAVVHYELLTEWRLGRSGSQHIVTGPLTLLTGEDEWHVTFVTRCPSHSCGGCHYELRPQFPLNQPGVAVPVVDTAVQRSAVGSYTAHSALLTSASGGNLLQPLRWTIGVRDQRLRSEQLDEEAAHLRCPGEGFVVRGVSLPAPGQRAAIAMIADNQYATLATMGRPNTLA
jgi:hypothetical protein